MEVVTFNLLIKNKMDEDTLVLAVDDDTTNLELITEFLMDEGYRLLTARDGREALKILEATKEQFKVIILDWMMPEINGIELLAILKQDKKYKDIPVIMQTAKTEKKDIIEGIGEGAYQYLTKPFDDEILLSMVHSAVDAFNRLHSITEQAEEDVKGIREYAFKMIKRETEKQKLDLHTHKVINDFFMRSVTYDSYEDLSKGLLNTIKEFAFQSSMDPGEPPENNRLRCTLRVSSKMEVNASDRGVISNLDRMILSKAMESGQIVQRGTYSAIPSNSGLTAIMIRNTPKEKGEARTAIQIVCILLEMFEDKLLRFEHHREIAQKNGELARRDQQLVRLISTCNHELDNSDTFYQSLQEKQKNMLEELEPILRKKLPQLTDDRVADLKGILQKQLADLANFHSSEQVENQKFALVMRNFKNLFKQQASGKDGVNLGQMGEIEQSQMENLFASLGDR